MVRDGAILIPDLIEWLISLARVNTLRPLYLHWDNLRGHHNASVRATARRLGIELIYGIIQGGPYHCIEVVWSQAKKLFAKDIATFRQISNQAAIRYMVSRSIRRVPASTVANYLKVCLRRMVVDLEAANYN